MIGIRIKEYRKSQGLKITEFAKIIGISQGSLSNIENGNSKPSSDTISAIVRNTNIDPLWLLVNEYKGPAQRAAEGVCDEDEPSKGLARRAVDESAGLTEKRPRGLAQRIAEDGPEADSSIPWNDFHLGMGDSMELLVNIHKSGNKVLIRAINANLMAFNEAIENKERSEVTTNAIAKMRAQMKAMNGEIADLRQENHDLRKKILSRDEREPGEAVG